MTYLTDREINVIGIQRTGQHAITSWIIGHFDSVCYKNNMSQLGQRRGRAHGVEPPFWLFEPKKRDEWLDANEIPKDQDAIILGTEFSVYNIGLNPFIPQHKRIICESHGVDQFSKKKDNVLVIRNPYNQFASILNWGRNKLLSNTPGFSAMWIRMANECLDRTNILENKTVVNYDKWFSSIEERELIEGKLDIPRDDSRINIVMKIGYHRSWGSSFDGMKAKKNAQKMNVLNRWETVKDNPKFIDLCKNDKITELAKEFGWEKPL
jgi:hypothetical protein